GANLALMQSDGNFVLYNSYAAVWASNTWMYPGAWLIAQDDGNLVIYTAEGSPVWASNAVLYCGDNHCDAPEDASSCPQDCDPCYTNPCACSSDPCCGNPDPCCGSPDPCCGKTCCPEYCLPLLTSWK